MNKYLFKIVFIVLVVSGVLIWFNHKFPSEYVFCVFFTKNEEVEMQVVDRYNKTITQVVFPGDIWINTVNKKGQWRLDKLYNLRNKFGDDWQIDSLSEVLGNGIGINNEDLNLVEKMKLLTIKLGFQNKSINIKEKGVISEKMAPDGEIIKTINKANYQNIKKQLFMDNELALVQDYVIVVNASGIDGVGLKAAESIDLTGAHVFDVMKSGVGDEDSCIVDVDANRKVSKLVKWLTQRFDCKINELPSEMVTVKIGKNYGNKIIDLL